ncbi:MAG: xanthine dehydrogenase family protein molybdopterin-binding subunit [Actinomycetota bacterium]
MVSIAPSSSSPPAIGSPVRRVEDRQLVTGAAGFVADLRTERTAVNVAFVRSPLASAVITGIDTSAALGEPGVVAVLTGHDLDADPTVDNVGPYSTAFGPELAQALLPVDRVGFAGEAIVAVVAETTAEAVDAAEQVVVDLDPTEPVLDLDHALAATVIEESRVVGGHAPDPARFEPGPERVVVELAQWSPRQLPTPIEARAVTAEPLDDGRLEVLAATQTPHAFRSGLARVLRVEADAIRVVAPAVGGGFGGKTTRTPEEYLVPVLARRLGRPVSWHETRSEYFATATQGRGERITLTLAGDRDGRLTALRADVVKDGGAYPLVGLQLPGGYTMKMANGCYDIGHVEFTSVGVLTNRPPTSAYRGAGRSPYVAALERVVDRFAAAVGIDPTEVRRRNLIRPAQLPYTTPTGAVYDEADYPGDLERALAAAGFDELRAEQARRRATGEVLALGIGLASYSHMTTGGGGEEASVTIEPDGTATVVTGTTSQGHGHATTWAQIAAAALTLPIERIRVVEGDTDAIASGVGAVGSRSLQTAGIAIHRSATEVRERARRWAADELEAAVDDVVVADDGSGFHVVGTPARSMSWGEVATAAITGAAGADADGDAELSCGEFYDTEGRNTFPSGAHVAVVDVDTETGLVTLRRLVAVDDAGTVVNPTIVEGQLHGGIASAVGQVLGEVIVHDDAGNQLTSSLLDYPIPTTDQLPSFEVIPSATPSSFNQLGFKGVGESGTVGATGAVHNAVLDAIAHLGVEHLDLPCTPERIWMAIQAATAPAS